MKDLISIVGLKQILDKHPEAIKENKTSLNFSNALITRGRYCFVPLPKISEMLYFVLVTTWVCSLLFLKYAQD